MLFYAHILALFVFCVGVYHFGRFLYGGDWQNPQKLVHGLLQAIELLLLVPVPIVIGIIVSDLLLDMAHPEEIEFSKGERSYSIAKVFLVGIIITLAGTALLDLIISGNADWEALMGGAAVVLSLSVYVFVTLHGTRG